MTASEYSTYLDRTAVIVEGWETHFRKIDPATLKLSERAAKYFAIGKSTCLQEAWQIQEAIKKERVEPKLSREIAMLYLIQRMPGDYTGLLSLMPKETVPKEWSDFASAIQSDASLDLALPLFKQIEMKADLLER